MATDAMDANTAPADTAPADPRPLIVVLGLGEMGLIHAENLSKVRAIRLGLASTRADALSTAAARLHADATYASYTHALADPSVRAVVIATPPRSHPEMVARCARAGKHIFCEKPLGASSPAIRDSLAAVSAARVRFMAGFQRRWDRAFAAARARVRAGEMGRPVVLRCTTGDPEYPDKYRRDAQPNALLLDLGVHDIDMARWLTGSEVVTAYAVVDALTYPALKEKGDGDVCVAILEMRDASKVVLHLSRAFAYGYNVTTDFVGSKGTLQIGDLRVNDVVEIRDRARASAIQFDFRERFEQAFEAEMAAFADLVCAREDDVDNVLEDPRYASAEDGLLTTVVAEALVRSAESGVPEQVIYQ